jgi:hypothetical protein
MSNRDPGNVWVHSKDTETDLYDLNKFNEDYWTLFESFLNLTAEREIIAQIELWDRFDFALEGWQNNPYNPKNNINYTSQESGLKQEINSHPRHKENSFFRTVPSLDNNIIVLKFQQLHVKKLLSFSLKRDNVLYCISNETNESPKWGAYWANYIRERAQKMGTFAETTEMWEEFDIRSEQHHSTYDHPELYSFLEISQNNHLPPEEHWDNLIAVRKYIIESGQVRPINSVKIYGANSAWGDTLPYRGWYGTSRQGQERFWRNIFAGLASSRFHRGPSGLNLSKVARVHIRSMRMIEDEVNIFNCEPHNDLLLGRKWNEAYCIANIGVEYSVFFPDGGNLLLDISKPINKSLNIKWLDIHKCEWTDEAVVKPITKTELAESISTIQINRIRSSGPFLFLRTPRYEGYWAGVIQVVK